MRKCNYFFSLLLLLGGCTVGPEYTPPAIDGPSEWNSPIQSEMSFDAVECFHWWESFNDPTLNYLIETASRQNLDVKIASTKILEARTYLQGKEADAFPHIDGSLNYGRVGYNQKDLDKILGVDCYEHRHRRNINIFEAGFDAEWELDLLGMRQHEVKALKANAEAAEESMRDLMVTLTAEIARNYVELRGSQLRLDLIEKNIHAQTESVQLVEGLLKTGFASNTDHWESEEQLHLLQAEKPLLELSITKSIHKLSILTGSLPNELYCLLAEHQPLPELPSYQPLGLPCELLRNRPDIQKAERDLAAATEKIGVATAALFPRLSLVGFIGDISTNLNKPGYVWYGGPQLLAPIFNSRLIQEDITLNKIRTRQAFYIYEKTVFEAFEETENALTAYHQELQRNQSLLQAKMVGQKSYDETFFLYQRGFKGYLDALTANRSLLAQEGSYVDSKIQLLIRYIALYKALGGGWEIQ